MSKNKGQKRKREFIQKTFNAGDVVIIRSFDNMVSEYGMLGEMPDTEYGFVKGMQELCGNEYVIDSVVSVSLSEIKYYLKGINDYVFGADAFVLSNYHQMQTDKGYNDHLKSLNIKNDNDTKGKKDKKVDKTSFVDEIDPKQVFYILGSDYADTNDRVLLMTNAGWEVLNTIYDLERERTFIEFTRELKDFSEV